VGENIHNIKKNTEAILDTGKKFGIEVNPEKTKYMLKSRSQKIRRKHSIKVANRSFEDVATLKYLRTTPTQNCMREEFKSRINPGNSCFSSVQSLLPSHLVPRNVKIEI
jgi:hypothetical protein